MLMVSKKSRGDTVARRTFEEWERPAPYSSVLLLLDKGPLGPCLHLQASAPVTLPQGSPPRVLHLKCPLTL